MDRSIFYPLFTCTAYIILVNIRHGKNLDLHASLSLIFFIIYKRLKKSSNKENYPICRSGGIGRRRGLKILRVQTLASSSLASGTI